MTAYHLEALLSVRRFREESAARALRRANDAVREARRALDASLTALEDWRARLPEEVDRRYRAILGQTLSTEDLARFHLGLAELASHEVQLAAEVDRCRSACDACERAAAEAEKAVSSARRSTAKIEKHRSIWAEDRKKEAERAADLEFEEFRPRGRLGETNDNTAA